MIKYETIINSNDNDLQITIKYNKDNSVLNNLSINIYKYEQLLECKCKIEKNLELWDKNKKKKNHYELVFVSNRIKYLNVSNYIPISRSFFKLWEIFHDIKYSMDSSIRTVHIAEGPGGFIESTIKYCEREKITIDSIDAITLKEDNVNVPDWNMGNKLIKNNNIKIHYGIDNTGNIYNIGNILDFIIKVGKNSVDIITADGGFDYSIDYNKQEQLSYRLFLCEIAIAVSLQKMGGMYIFKIFDISTEFTIQLLFILYKSYDKISITKPNTSRMANSEKYIICEGFKGVNIRNLNNLYSAIGEWTTHDQISLVDIDIIYDDKIFIDKIYKYNSMYLSFQIKNINTTLSQLTRDDFNNQIKNAYRWCSKYKIDINKNNKYRKFIDDICLQ